MTLDPAQPRLARARPRAARRAAPALHEPPRPTSVSTRRGSCHASGIDEFIAWIATLRALPELDGREMIIWGDMFAGDAELVAQLPDGVTVCEWGYDGGYPFDERAAMLADAGVPFWVAPGTSSWLTILGRSPT